MVRPVSNANDKILPVIEECGAEGEVTRQLRQHGKTCAVRKWPKESFRRRLYLTTRKEKYELSIRNTI